MIHTIQLYCRLSNDEVSYIIEKFNKDIRFVADDMDELFPACTTAINRKHGEWAIYIVADIIKLLRNPIINESDYKEVEAYLNTYMNKLGLIYDDLTLIRIDYRMDVLIKDKNEREALFRIYRKAIDKYGFRRKYSKYDTTVYFNTKSTQVAIYDKEEERDRKHIMPERYEENMLRFEFRVQNRHLNYKKRKRNIGKSLKNYFSDDFYIEYMSSNCIPILYQGDYYKIFKADTIINNSSLSETDKKSIRRFLIDISENGITGVKEMLDEKGKLMYSKYKFNRFKGLLEELKINPILIPKNFNCSSYIENPFKINKLCSSIKKVA
ncbi:phage/plasmid replication domain-containing protein [Clostridium sp. UBA1353]|uniref:phage/plasmid replication domain-containing protein n=1 Tax=Clostridium sp. UBA1353 TaxID=1946347 RepID=UPI003216D804